jgi:hypothetical protein
VHSHDNGIGVKIQKGDRGQLLRIFSRADVDTDIYFSIGAANSPMFCQRFVKLSIPTPVAEVMLNAKLRESTLICEKLHVSPKNAEKQNEVQRGSFARDFHFYEDPDARRKQTSKSASYRNPDLVLEAAPRRCKPPGEATNPSSSRKLPATTPGVLHEAFSDGQVSVMCVAIYSPPPR